MPKRKSGFFVYGNSLAMRDGLCVQDKDIQKFVDLNTDYEQYWRFLSAAGRQAWHDRGQRIRGMPMAACPRCHILDHIKAYLNIDNFDNNKVGGTGENMPPSIQNFSQSGLVPVLVENIRKSGFSEPTPIQKHAVPVIFAGRDLIAFAPTGSGKTSAFLLPIIQSILLSDDTSGKPQAIIVAPTLKLAIQIEREARKFSYGTDCRTVCIYGGVYVAYHTRKVRRGCEILVATPGRLHQLINDNSVGVDDVRFLVLDEADRMLENGFEPIIRQILGSKHMPSKEKRQTLMFSATFPVEIQSLAREFLKPDYIFKAMGILGGAIVPVVQKVLYVTIEDKKEKLLELLQKDLVNAKDASGAWVKKTLIFVETNRKADFISTVLSQNGLPSTSIHGDRHQCQREEALCDFKSGNYPFLVATSVASRGLDIKGVDHVINYDLPLNCDIADYIHRVGRTGRVDTVGRATTFYNQEENSPITAKLVKILEDAEQEVPEGHAVTKHCHGFFPHRPFQFSQDYIPFFTLSYFLSAMLL